MRRWLLISIMIALVTSCQSQPHYAKDVVQLDNFDFGLNIETFFDDESYFRITDDNYKLSSREESLDDTTYTYFRYTTESISSKQPLAQYKGVMFDDLNMLTDSTDQHVLLINGSKDYATLDEVKKVLDNLLQTKPKPEYVDTFIDGTSIIFRGKDRIVTVYVNTAIDLLERDNSNYDYNKEYTDEELEEMQKSYFTQNSYQELIQKLERKESDLQLSIFVIDPTFDKIYNRYNSGGRSGFMVRYKTK